MTSPSPLVVILAGGLGRRFGGADKSLLVLAGRPLLEHVLERVRGQGTPIVLNANGDHGRFAKWGLPVVPDTVPGWPGPLAGILAAMEWASANHPDKADVLSVPADTPFVPINLGSALSKARAAIGRPDAVAMAGGRLHPLAGLWSVSGAAALREAITREGLRKAEEWVRRRQAATVSFDPGSDDAFLNINTPADLAAAESIVARSYPG